MTSPPTVNEAYAAAESFCDRTGIDPTTTEGNVIRMAFAAGFLSGAIRGADATAEMIMEHVRRVLGND